MSVADAVVSDCRGCPSSLGRQRIGPLHGLRSGSFGCSHGPGHGAARHLPQTELTPERLAAELRAATRADLLAMAERARALARPQAAARVADELERLVA